MSGFSETPRRAVVAGRFYPDDAEELARQVAACLAVRPPEPAAVLQSADALAVLMPHAGYVFSGAIAGMTLDRVDVPERIIVLGPNHTGQGERFAVWSGGGWETPLGVMSIDTHSRETLVASDAGFAPDMAAHDQEHSLEVLVPFFQMKNPAARMVPIIVGGAPLPALEAAGNALADCVAAAMAAGERILLVISSDMSHYLPHDKAATMDAMALHALETLDAEKFFTVVRGKNISMCGVYPATMVLFALARLGGGKAHRIAYATSGQTGRAFGADMDRVVGYAGVVFTRRAEPRG